MDEWARRQGGRICWLVCWLIFYTETGVKTEKRPKFYGRYRTLHKGKGF